MSRFVPDITRNDLADIHGFSQEEIVELDQESQHILGKTLMMIDYALRDTDDTYELRIGTALTFIETAMRLIEHNFESLVESKLPKTQIN